VHSSLFGSVAGLCIHLSRVCMLAFSHVLLLLHLLCHLLLQRIWSFFGGFLFPAHCVL
jgi:hypothetical protein